MLGDVVLPGAGAIWYGQPAWIMGPAPSTASVCLLMAYPTYLIFGVLAGREITNASGRIRTGQGMPRVKLRS
jgi:hypothetical protein